MTDILIPALAMAALGLLFALGLVLAYLKLQVPEDPRLAVVADVLPQANCGGCGFAGCRALAEAMVAGRALPESCPVGGAETARRVAEILGLSAGQMVKKIARVHCRGTWTAAKSRGVYRGIASCRSAHLMGGNKLCTAACLGLADCVRSCPFDAMAMGDDGLPVVYEDKCTACGKCVEACPRNIMELHPEAEEALVFCRSHDRGPVARKHCDNACIACNICVRDFPEAIVMDNYLAKIVDESRIPRDKLEKLGRCPTGAIGRIQRISHDR